MSRWVSSPSLVRISSPSVSMSRRPTGKTRGSVGHEGDHRGPAVGVLGGADHAGRLVEQVVDEARGAPGAGTPSSSTRSTAGSTRRPRTGTAPLTVTRPSAISSSQTRRRADARRGPAPSAVARRSGAGRRVPAPSAIARPGASAPRARPGPRVRAAGPRPAAAGRAGRARAAPGRRRWWRRARPARARAPARRRRCSPRCSSRRTTPSTLTPRRAAIWARDTGCL